ncbi:MAG: HD family hydrolase [Chloroflexi bacterium]|nr:MAG: HD family hydrolase [Chloroflexota bacterium]
MSEATDALLQVLLQANRLKVTPRGGWAVRGLTDVESVADHSFGVAFIALVLAETLDEPVDRAKLLAIALLHDLPESVLTDIPTPALRYFPSGAKREAEMKALTEVLEGVPFASRFRAWWQEFEDRTSVEGRLVRDADRLELLLQAYVYERTTANRYLEEFWAGQEGRPFEFPISQQLFERLLALRHKR